MVLMSAHLYAEWIFIGANAVAQGCSQLVWHSSTEEQGRRFTFNTAAVHWCLVTAHLYAEWMFIGVNVIGVNAVVQGCCQLVWYSSIHQLLHLFMPQVWIKVCNQEATIRWLALFLLSA